MSSTNKKLVAVIGATGQQGGGVVRALQAREGFKVRALTRDPDRHRELADEVVEADLNRPETLNAAFEGAHGVFLVTNFREAGIDELKQATAAVRAAKEAGVQHFVWSTLPNVEAISGGKFDVPHFTGKAKIDRIVKEAGFPHHTFVIAPGYYQIFAGSFPGATEIAEMFSYWEAHTYLGSGSSDQIALANKIAGLRPTKFSTWARANFHVQAP